MRLVQTILLLAVTASPAFAQREPEIVIPGKPGVPVYINGIDASWGVVESDFGLDRPGLLAPTVVYRPLLAELPATAPSYHPKTGKRPGYGRLEINPPLNRRLPPPAPTFYRNWSIQSAPTPATDPSSYSMPMPNIEVSPYFGRRGRHRSRGSGSSGDSGSSENSGSSSGSGSGHS